MKVITKQIKLIVPDDIEDETAIAEMEDMLREIGEEDLQIMAWGLVTTKPTVERMDFKNPPVRPYGPNDWANLTSGRIEIMDAWADNVYAWQRHAEAVVLNSLGLPCTRWCHASMHEYEKLDTCPVCNQDISGESL